MALIYDVGRDFWEPVRFASLAFLLIWTAGCAFMAFKQGWILKLLHCTDEEAASWRYFHGAVRVLAVGMACAGFLITVFLLTSLRARHVELSKQLTTCSVAQGVVSGFVAENPASDAAEQFVVAGTTFRFRQGFAGGGYHQTRAHGASIAEGDTLKVCYLPDEDNVILRIERLSSPQAS